MRRPMLEEGNMMNRPILCKMVSSSALTYLYGYIEVFSQTQIGPINRFKTLIRETRWKLITFTVYKTEYFPVRFR